MTAGSDQLPPVCHNHAVDLPALSRGSASLAGQVRLVRPGSPRCRPAGGAESRQPLSLDHGLVPAELGIASRRPNGNAQAVTDWLQDPSLSDAEKIARYEALTEGGEVLFADPLIVTVSDAIVVDHPPLGQASVSRLRQRRRGNDA